MIRFCYKHQIYNYTCIMLQHYKTTGENLKLMEYSYIRVMISQSPKIGCVWKSTADFVKCGHIHRFQFSSAVLHVTYTI